MLDVPDELTAGIPDSDPALSSGDIIAFIVAFAVANDMWDHWYVALVLALLPRVAVRFMRRRKIRAAARNWLRYLMVKDRVAKHPNPGDPTPTQLHPLLEGWQLECQRLGLMVDRVAVWKATTNHEKSTTYQPTSRRAIRSRLMWGFDKNVTENPCWYERVLHGDEDPIKTWKKMHKRAWSPKDRESPD